MDGGWSHLYVISSPQSLSFGELKTLFYSTMYDTICDLHFVGPGAYQGQLWVILPLLKSF